MDSPLRRDGFILVLEWRKGQTDSPLLSDAFHSLASLVRDHLKIETGSWGLYPAKDVYADKVCFTDKQLFAEQENVNQVGSAYGAVLVGLWCAVQDDKTQFGKSRGMSKSKAKAGRDW